MYKLYIIWIIIHISKRMVIICRHGQTEWNRAWKLQWSQDSPLTQVWVVQALQVSHILEWVYPKVQKIFSSPQGRALSTSKILANTLALPHSSILQDDLLKEMSFWEHEWLHKHLRKEGILWEQMQARDADPYNVSFPWGENYSEVRDRARQFIQTADIDSASIIVAHEAFNRMLLLMLLNCSDNQALEISQPNDVVYRYQFGNIYHKRVDSDGKWTPWFLKK